MRTYQLRRYVVNLGELDAFVDEWVRDVVPLRERFGFRIEGAWIVRDEHRFIWLVSYEGDDGFEAASERYFRSPARAAIRPSTLVAALRITNGRPSRINMKNGWFISTAAVAPTPTSTCTPGWSPSTATWWSRTAAR